MRERRSGGSRGRRFRLRLFRPHRLAGCPRRRAGRLQFAYHRIGIDGGRCGGREVAGNDGSPGPERSRRELGSVKVTVKSSRAGTETEQGVLQPGPSEVRASAPERAWNSSWTVTVGGVDLNESIRMWRTTNSRPGRGPLAAITMTRRMVHPSLSCGEPPQPPARTIEASMTRRATVTDRNSLSNG